MVSEKLIRKFVEEKLKLLYKQELDVTRDRFSQVQDIILQIVSPVVTAGGLQETATGTVFEPPFICEWIIPPFRDIFCGPPEGSERNMKLDKAIYGVTKYGWSFYDPAYDILHIIKTMQYAFVRPEISKKIGQILTESGVSDIASIVMVFQHYAIGALVSEVYKYRKTPVYRASDIYSALPTVEWGGETLYKLNVPGVGETWFDTVSSLLFGFILGVTPLGYGFLLPKKTEVLSDYFYRWLADRIVSVLVKYKPGYAATKATKKTVIAYGEKMTYEHERYGEKRALYYLVKRRIWMLLEGYGLDNLTRQAYVSAAVELVFAPYGPREIGGQYVRKYKYDLDWDDLVRHWRAKWVALGLKAEILDIISREVKGIWERLQRRRQLLQSLLARQA